MDSARIQKDLKPYKLYIDGKWVGPASTLSIPVMNPATGEQLSTIPDANAADVDRAVQAARRAFERGVWRKMDVSARERIIWRIGELIEKNKEELALLESLNNGKTYAEALRGDIPPTADIFYYYAGWARRSMGKPFLLTGII